MAKRGYKLQEFVAHSANVNCLSLAKKSCRLLVTGGDDHKVNLWAVGKPTSLMSLCGHTSPVQSVVFDAEEVLVLAGSTSGVIKLWDLEETKMVRGLTGHRSNCTAVQFHPFGEFFASGSMDTNLKIWDIRQKGCIHTYKGHTRGIGTIRFTPDGRWVVSGGLDNLVKVWDLTAGKLLHDFKFHEGHIRSLDFHPLEFLLATGSADRTVKFWDLETFELIGSSRPEATGVCSVAFHPDGRTLFSGLEDGLKVYSWEPVVCHDSVDIGWSTLGDLCISEGKVLGCSYYQDSIGIWVADTSHIEPYGASCTLEQNDSNNRRLNILENHASLKAGSGIRAATRLWSPSPEFETKEIKNIYVDTAAGDHAALRRVSSLNSPKFVMPEDSDEISKQPAEKQDLCSINSSEDSVNKTFLPSNVVPRDSTVGIEISNSPRESITFSRTKPGMLLRPAHTRRATNKSEVEKLPKEVQCLAASNIKSKVDDGVDLDGQVRPLSGGEPRKSCEDKELNMTSIVERSQCTLLPPTSPNQEIYAKSLNTGQDVNSVKVVRGVAIVSGRTRSLVERFEQREKLNSCEEQPVNSITHVMPETDMRPTIMKEETQISESPLNSASDVDASRDQNSRSTSSSAGGGEISDGQISKGEPMPVASGYMCPISERESFSSSGSIPSNSATDVDANRDQNSRITSSSAGTGRVSGSQISKESTPAAGGYVTKNPISERESFSSSGRSPSNSASDVDASREQNSRITSSSAEIGRISGSQFFKESTPAGGGYVARSHISERESFSSSGRSPSNSASDVDASREQTSRRTSSFGRTGKISGSQIRKGELTPAKGGYITVSRISERESLSSSGRNTKITGSQNFIKHQHSRSLSASGGNWKTIRDQNSKTGSVAASGILDASPISEEDSFSYSGNSIDMIESQSFTGESDSSNNCNIITTESEVLGKKSVCPTDRDIMEILMRTHDVCLSTFRSRLTKLQVVRHFWEKSDVKGAINALQKLPDHSVGICRKVQADVISVLMEKMEILPLNLFPCLLPVLTGLLDSTMERHVSVSLEMLLKLVPVFCPVIRSTLSARRGVGVDLHAEERREWCKQCSIHLQKIQEILPAIIRRGGSISRNAEELNLVLQES